MATTLSSFFMIRVYFKSYITPLVNRRFHIYLWKDHITFPHIIVVALNFCTFWRLLVMADILEAGEDALRARDGFHRKSSISRHVSIKEMRLFTIEARNKAQLISCPPIMITEPAPGDSLPSCTGDSLSSCTGDSLPSCTRSTNPALLLPPKKRHHGPARMVNVSFHQKRRYSAFERNVKGEKKRSDKENYVFCEPPSPEGHSLIS